MLATGTGACLSAAEMGAGVSRVAGQFTRTSEVGIGVSPVDIDMGRGGTDASIDSGARGTAGTMGMAKAEWLGDGSEPAAEGDRGGVS